MVKEPKHGWLVVCPDLSPENVHAGSNHKATIAAGVTMDNELVSDLFHEVIASAGILNTDKDLASHYKQLLTQMPPMQIGHWGQSYRIGWKTGMIPQTLTAMFRIFTDYIQAIRYHLIVRPNFLMQHAHRWYIVEMKVPDGVWDGKFAFGPDYA